MSASDNIENDQEISFPDIGLLDRSKSFHSSVEGKVWIRLLINLCWWIHDMYEVEGQDSNAKFSYIEVKLNRCKSLFPGKFLLIFSNPDFLPNKQHPFLICRHDEHKTILLIFRATVSTKSIQDVFTDLQFYANHEVYEGDRHAGFASRTESGPLMAVVNWLQKGWKIIVSGHSLGGAVSQLFTAKIIDSLVEIGLTIDQVVLRCVTFGTPQCADRNFWSKYSAWYEIFDSYVYENDAIFRLATFGDESTRNIIQIISNKITATELKFIKYMSDDQQTGVFNFLGENIGQTICDILVPAYSVFGRHHFIMKDQLARFTITSIGESLDEKEMLMSDLRDENRPWYHYFVEKQLFPNPPLKFTYREFLNHGCYPFSINQMFNEAASQRLGKNNFPKQQLLRSSLSNGYSKSIFNLSAFIYLRDEIDVYPDYIYLEGFLVDFIRYVKLPIELAESEQLRQKKPETISENSYERAILCYKSTRSSEFIKKHSKFFIQVTTFFNECDVEVAVLSNSINSVLRKVEELDPISTVLRAYYELVLDASSGEQYNHSPLNQCFSTLLGALQQTDCDESDKILARYLAEIRCRNYFNDTEKYLENLQMPLSDVEAYKYFENQLVILKKQFTDVGPVSDEKCKTAKYLYTALITTLTSQLFKEDQRTILTRLFLVDLNGDDVNNEIFQLFDTKIDTQLFDLDGDKIKQKILELQNIDTIDNVSSEFNFQLKRLWQRVSNETKAKMLEVNGAKIKGTFLHIHGEKIEVKVFDFNVHKTKARLNMMINNDDFVHESYTLFTTGSDAHYFRKRFKEELHRHNWIIMPSTELPLLNLDITQIREYLQRLHSHREVDIIINTLKCIMAVFFFIKIRLKRLTVVFEDYPWYKLVIKRFSKFLYKMYQEKITNAYSPWASSKLLVNKVRQTLMQISKLLLISTGENVHENEAEWLTLKRLSGCNWLHEIIKVKTEQERDSCWSRIFTKEPLMNVPIEHRRNWIEVIRLCSQLTLMHEILLRKPPKVVISGRSQTGKSTLFKYLTGRNLEELRNINAFNTRMSLQCPALIKFNDTKDNKDDSGLAIDIVDNPGQDDATEQAKNLLDMTLHSASLFIVVATLEDVNGTHTIELIKRLLRETQTNILVLINKVDVRLFEEYKKFKQQSSADDESDSCDWENSTEVSISPVIQSNANFSPSDTIKNLIKRPTEELRNSLTISHDEFSRLTVIPVILKDFHRTDTEYAELSNFGQYEKGFVSQVSKSNVNKWIIENLTNSST